MKTVFTIKSTEGLKLNYKPGSSCYLGQTLNRLEAKKPSPRPPPPPLAALASGSKSQKNFFLACNLYIEKTYLAACMTQAG